MYCKRCGTELSSEDKFCKKCGLEVESNNIEDNNNYKQENDVDIKEDFDIRLMKAYIGKNADKIYNSIRTGLGINGWAFLFGTIYYCYRKMYLVTIIAYISVVTISFIVPSITKYIWLFLDISFCSLYKWDITRKIKKIKQNNPNASEDELLDIARRKGGTSIIGALFMVVIQVFLLYIILIERYQLQ